MVSVLLPSSQGLNNAVALDFDYREQMIYWTDVTTQGSMIRRMHINGSNVQVGDRGSPQAAAPSLFPVGAQVGRSVTREGDTSPVIGSPQVPTRFTHVLTRPPQDVLQHHPIQMGSMLPQSSGQGGVWERKKRGKGTEQEPCAGEWGCCGHSWPREGPGSACPGPTSPFSLDRFFTALASVTPMGWQWTGWEATCTGVTKVGTPSKCPSSTVPTAQCW